MQFPGSTYTEIHTSNISASAQKTPAAASNKHIRTLLPLSQLRWQMQTSARTSTFSGPLMIYLGKTECYLLGEMRLVLGEKWYGRCCEASVRQMKIFWCLKHPAGKPTVCAYLHNSHTNIGPFSDQTNANINIQGSGGSQATSESIRGTTSIRGTISSNAKPKAKQAEPSASLHKGRNFYLTFRKKKWTQSSWKQMVLWCAASVFLYLHHPDPSRTGEHQDFIEIPVRRGWGIGRGIENLFIPGFCSVSIRRHNLARSPTVTMEAASSLPESRRYWQVLTGIWGVSRCFLQL